jgi:hypothetical protein
MKYFFIITWMASVLCCGAENTTTTELLRPIIEASGKSFPDFVSATTAIEVPPLPLPKNTGAASPIDVVSAIVWKRLSTVDVVVTPANKAEKLEVLQSMGKLRAWLLKHDAYANLFFAAYIEESVSMSTLAALSDGNINVEEAKQLVASLAPNVTMDAMIAAVQRCAPQSSVLRQIKDAGAGKAALLTISDRLAGELNEQVDTRITNLTEQERPASLAFYVALSSSTTRMAAILIDLAAKGGDLNLLEGKVAGEIKRLMPEVIGNVDPASGMKIEAAMFGGLMQNVRKWKSRH